MSTTSPIQSFTKWLQLKIYQAEVTFSVYIFTPLEKFIFCTLFSPLNHPPPIYVPTCLMCRPVLSFKQNGRQD